MRLPGRRNADLAEQRDRALARAAVAEIGSCVRIVSMSWSPMR